MKSIIRFTNYIVWGMFSIGIGAGLSIGVFVGGSKLADIYNNNSSTFLAQASSALDMTEEESILSDDTNLFNTESEEIISDSLATRENSFKNIIPQPRALITPTHYVEVPLIDSYLFDKGSCPSKDVLEQPRYFAPMSRGFDIGKYVPSFLVKIEKEIPTKDNRSICIDETTAVNLLTMLRDARDAGHHIVITSGYRSRTEQKSLYADNIAEHGKGELLRVAEPGHSEHQLGTTVDLAAASDDYASASLAFAKSPEGKWITKHASQYGFVMSYPKGYEDETGYIYEPWHWRFVGTDNVDIFNKDTNDTYVQVQYLN